MKLLTSSFATQAKRVYCSREEEDALCLQRFFLSCSMKLLLLTKNEKPPCKNLVRPLLWFTMPTTGPSFKEEQRPLPWYLTEQICIFKICHEMNGNYSNHWLLVFQLQLFTVFCSYSSYTIDQILFNPEDNAALLLCSSTRNSWSRETPRSDWFADVYVQIH